MTHVQQQTNAAEIRLPELDTDLKELQAEEAARVNGGIIAILIGLAVPQPPAKSSLTVGGASSPQP